jgi:hypothetical protein
MEQPVHASPRLDGAVGLDEAALSMRATQAQRLLYKVMGPFMTVHDVGLAHGSCQGPPRAGVKNGSHSARPETQRMTGDALSGYTSVQQVKCRFGSALSLGGYIRRHDRDLVAHRHQGICLCGSNPTRAAQERLIRNAVSNQKYVHKNRPRTSS